MISLFPSRQIFFTVGAVNIHWYGVMYALAFVFGIWFLPRMLRLARFALSKQDQETFILWVFLGVVLGGRLGYVSFYAPSYFLEHPAKIIAVWEGGMSSHGGFIGVTIALLIFSARKRIDIFRLGDILVVPVAVGLALGRLGNLINGELYGTVTALPWGMHFPDAERARHPTQIYAMLKDMCIAAACFLHLSRSADSPMRSGRTTALFLMLYGVLRFCVEIFRDQPYGYTNVSGVLLSKGQSLTIPIFIIGVLIWFSRRRRRL